MTKERIIKLAALIPLVFGLTACTNKKVDANKYLEIKFDGYETVGTAAYNINFEQMVKDNLKAFDLDKESSDKSIKRAVKKLGDIVQGEMDKTSGLSNGDKVKFEWDIDDDDLKDEFPVKLSFSDKEFEVKKLGKAEKFDPFDYFEVEFKGISPNGTINIERVDWDKLPQLSLEADKKNKLTNGDEVNVKVCTYSGDDLTQYCIENGMIPERTEKEFTVEWLKSYAGKLSEIGEYTYYQIETKIKENLDDHIKSKWGKDEILMGFTLAANYLLVAKDTPGFMMGYNRLYSVYKVDVKNSEGALSYYYYSYMDDVLTNDAGLLSLDLDHMYFPAGGSTGGSAYGESFNTESGKYYYVGYKDLDTLFNEKVAPQSDAYNIESLIK